MLTMLYQPEFTAVDTTTCMQGDVSEQHEVYIIQQYTQDTPEKD